MFSPSLDTSPILVYPLLITAGKVTDFAELPTLSPALGAWHENSFPHLRLEGWMGQRDGISSSQAELQPEPMARRR